MLTYCSFLHVLGEEVVGDCRTLPAFWRLYLPLLFRDDMPALATPGLSPHLLHTCTPAGYACKEYWHFVITCQCCSCFHVLGEEAVGTSGFLAVIFCPVCLVLLRSFLPLAASATLPLRPISPRYYCCCCVHVVARRLV